MNFTNLFELQEILDEKIKKEHGLDGESLLSQKTLALQVEIAELANETKCFKFWNNKNVSNHKIILEELVNSLYFILSLGIEKKFNDIINIQFKKNDCTITSQFLNLYVDINDFLVCSSKDHYITLFEDFFSLGFSLGYSIEQIQEAYNKSYMDTNYINQPQYS